MLAYGLIAGWRLDEEAGNTRADVLGVATLTETGGTVQSAPGKIGNAANFVGTAPTLQYAGGAIFTSGSFTLACWINWTSGGSVTTACLSQKGAANRQFIGINGSSGVPFFSVNATLSNEGSVLSGVWQHLAMSYDSTIQSFTTYQNGVIIATHKVAATYATPNGVLVGFNTANLMIDEAYMWIRALTQVDANQLYDAGSAGLSYPWTDGKSL